MSKLFCWSFWLSIFKSATTSSLVIQNCLKFSVCFYVFIEAVEMFCLGNTKRHTQILTSRVILRTQTFPRQSIWNTTTCTSMTLIEYFTSPPPRGALSLRAHLLSAPMTDDAECIQARSPLGALYVHCTQFANGGGLFMQPGTCKYIDGPN